MPHACRILIPLYFLRHSSYDVIYFHDPGYSGGATGQINIPSLTMLRYVVDVEGFSSRGTLTVPDAHDE